MHPMGVAGLGHRAVYVTCPKGPRAFYVLSVHLAMKWCPAPPNFLVLLDCHTRCGLC